MDNVEKNREHIKAELLKLQDDDCDETYKKVWQQYLDVVMMLPDSFFFIRPKTEAPDYMLSWTGFARDGTPRLPSVKYKVHHYNGESPSVEVNISFTTLRGGTRTHSFFHDSLIEKNSGKGALAYVGRKMAEWVYDQL